MNTYDDKNNIKMINNKKLNCSIPMSTQAETSKNYSEYLELKKTNKNAQLQKITFSQHDKLQLDIMNVDVSKFDICRSYSGKSYEFRRVYDNKLYVLCIKPTPGSTEFLMNFGLKQVMEYDKPSQKYTDKWTGEYSMGIKLVTAKSDDGDCMDKATPYERHVIDVLNAIVDADKRGLVVFDQLNEATMNMFVRDTYSQSFAKDANKMVIKEKGLPKIDHSKAPVLNVKCNFKYVKGFKRDGFTTVPPEMKTCTTLFKKFSTGEQDENGKLIVPQPWNIDELLNNMTSGIYYIETNLLDNYSGKWSCPMKLNTAVLRLLPMNKRSYGDNEILPFSELDSE